MQVGGVWRYTDSIFSGAQLTTRITHPANGASNADMSQSIRWTSMSNAQAYVLSIGSTAGAHDLLTTAETQQTSYMATTLPANQNRLRAYLGEGRRRVAIHRQHVHSGALMSTLSTPVDGATNVDRAQPICWTTVPNAQAYVLWLGSAVAPGTSPAASKGCGRRLSRQVYRGTRGC